MKLYFNPLACSLASRIAAYEADKQITPIYVDKAKRTSDGRDFREIYPLGLVPALELPDGSLLTENAAVLQHLADAPADRSLQRWLCFIGTELHRNLAMLLDKHAPEAVHGYALEKVRPRLAYVDQHLAKHSFLLDQYTVADAYLFAVLNWITVIPALKLASYPALTAFHARMLGRPAVKRAFDEERELYIKEQRAIS
ncbi:MAG: glutathione binding-like protein [Kofleriaceae bacterium]